jgi:acyl-CoA thioester hydrolase
VSGIDREDRGRIDPGPQREGEYVGRIPITVRYSETDAQAVVYHSNFLVYFEVGRTDWVRKAGYPYRDLEQDGYALFVAESHLRFLAPAHYDDRLIIETRLVEVRTRSCTFHYRVVREKEEERSLVEGWTALVCVGEEDRAIPFPEELAGALRKQSAL